MKRKWTAALLAAVILMGFTAGGAAVSGDSGIPDPGSSADTDVFTDPGNDTDEPAASDGSPADAPESDGSGTPDIPDGDDPSDAGSVTEYEFIPQTNAYSFLAVSPQGTVSPFTEPVFRSGTVKVKGGSPVPETELEYEWFAADRTGAVESDARALGTSASFSAGDDPAYDLNRVETHYYLEKIYVGDRIVGQQLFYAAVMSTGMDLTVGAVQNGAPVADSLNVENGPITLTANYDYDYYADMRSHVQQNTKGSAVATTTQPSINTAAVRASWGPQDVANPGIVFTGGSGLNVWPPNNIPAGVTPVQPQLTVTSFSSPQGYTDFYFSMYFPFTVTANVVSGGTASMAGELRTLTRLVRIWSGEPAATPTPPSGEDQGSTPSDWTVNLFQNPPLTQAQSEALYKEIIAPYSDPNNRKTPFALAPAQMTADGYLTENSQKGLLGIINFIRRSAGLNMVTDISPQFNIWCQAGTDYMSAHHEFGHHVADGSGNQNAIRGLQDSNLSWVEYSDGAAGPLQEMQLGQFYDDDYNNLPNVGHRRWLLDCRLTKTGFGYTPPTSSNKGTYEATYVMDPVFGSAVPESLEAFPGIGAYPIELMDFRAWSIGLGALGGRSSSWTVSESDITMSITRLRDGRTWGFEPFGNSGSYLSKNTNWFTVCPAGRGSGPIILFRPAEIFSNGNFMDTEQLLGETYTIKIEGIKDENGAPRTIIYGTQFYSLTGSSVLQPDSASEPSAAATPTAAPVPTPTATTTPTPAPVSTPTLTPTPVPTPVRTPAPTLPPSSVPTPAPTPVRTPAPTPAPGPSASAGEAVQWWNSASGSRPVMSVNIPAGTSCICTWYALRSAGQDPLSGIRLPETGPLCSPDTAGWKSGQVYYFACVIQFADQQADGSGETVIPFAIHVEKLPEGISGGTGIEDMEALPVLSPGTDAGYFITLAPDAFDDPALRPEITVEDASARWTIMAAEGTGKGIVTGEFTGATAPVPDQVGFYSMEAVTGSGTIQFMVPVPGTMDAVLAGNTVYDDKTGAYTLPFGQEEAVISASWHDGNIRPPLAACVEYVWQLMNGADTRSAGPVLTPNGTVRQVKDNVWIATGENAGTAMLSGISAGERVVVTVTPYVPGTYESDTPVALSPEGSTVVAGAEPPVISYPSASAAAGQNEDVVIRPEGQSESGSSYTIGSPDPQGGPAAQIDRSTGVVTIAASELKRPGQWTYEVDAVWNTGTVKVPLLLTVDPPTPSISARPGAPFVLATEPDPAGSGLLLTGIPISRGEGICTSADVTAAAAIPAECTLTIHTSSGEILPEDEPVSTGCLAAVRNDKECVTYTIIVKGDVLGTGRLDVAQLICVASDLTGLRPLEGIYRLAGKLTPGDGPINIADLVALARMLTDADQPAF